MAEFLNNNVKFLRTQKNISQQNLADKIGVDRSTVSRIENGEIETTIDNAIKIANFLNVSLNDLVSKNLCFDNASPIELDDNMVSIPVLGVIKAGIPIEAQQDIIEYIEIPKAWTTGDRKYYGLKISGDSMYPKYSENDTVVFEDSRNYNVDIYNNKDCAVMVNGDDATFKKVTINENGITLTPYNLTNYEVESYSKEDIINKPIKVIGIAREKRTRV